MDRIKQILLLAGMITMIVIPSLLSYRIGHQRGQIRAQKDFKPDTLIVDHYHTDTVLKPIPYAVRVLDTVYVPKTDDSGICPADSVPIPITQAYFKKDSTYEAWVSGYRPELDSLHIFRHDQTIYIDRIQQVRKNNRWSIGISAGYGASVNNSQVYLSPYIGIGVSYNIFSW